MKKEINFKERSYSNKQLVSTEWRYLCNNTFDIYENVGKGIIKFFDKKYKITKNIPNLKKKYAKKKGKCIKVKNSSPEKMLAICSLGKIYKTHNLSLLEISIARKLGICSQVIADKYKDSTKCAICGEIVSKIASHLFNSHKDVDHKKYYDKYLKKDGEGKCSICGKPTKFVNMEFGYNECCCDKCSHEFAYSKSQKTWKKTLGVDNPFKSKKCQKKYKKTMVKRYGVESPNQSKEIQEEKRKRYRAKTGYDHPLKNPEVRKKIDKTNLKIRGVKNVFQDPNIIEQIKETNRKNCGYDYWHQMPGFQEVVKKNNRNKYNVDYPNQTKENRERVSKMVKESFINRRKRNKGNLSNSETIFENLLKEYGFKFKKEYKVNGKNFDFAIFKKDKLDCLVEIDGEYYHGLLSDNMGGNDWKRYSKVPNVVKFVVIDSLKIGYGIREVIRVFGMNHKEWKKDMLKNIPKEIQYPKFEDSFLRRTWMYMTNVQKTKKIGYEWIKSNIGKSIIIQFCPEYAFKGFEYSKERKNLFYSPFSSKNYLEGREKLKNIPKIMLKYINKKNKKIIVKQHSPEKMLAICALGKDYRSKEKFDKGTRAMVEYFKLNAKEV